MLFAALLVLWLVLSAKITPEILIFGIVLSAVLSRFCHRQNIWPAWLDRALLRLMPQIAGYLVFLLRDMILSCISVSRIILSPSLKELEPRLFFYEPPLKDEALQVVLADSITLTPGTFTVGLYSGSILSIHAINGDMSEGVRDMELVPLLQKMEDTVREERQKAREGKAE